MCKNKYLRWILIFLGSISLILGIIGIIVPGLPTTPFILLSGFLYAKGSDKFYSWLVSHKYFGKKIRNYKENNGIPLKVKFRILVIMIITVSISSLLFFNHPILIYITIFGAFVGAMVIFFYIPSSKK